MSVARGCMVIEKKPGEWFCVVAQNEYDYEFRRGSTAYGPAKTDDDAWDMMKSHESNPGSVDTYHHGDVTTDMLDILARAYHPDE